MIQFLKRVFFFFGAIITSFCLLLIALVYFYSRATGGPVRYELVTINRGDSFYRFARQLEERGFVKSRRAFYYLARLENRIPHVKAGEYLLNSRMGNQEIIDLITGGRVQLVDITVIEGSRFRDIAVALEHKYFFSADLFEEAAQNLSLLHELNIRAPSVEGYLYPDTYRFAHGVSPKEIIRSMVSELVKRYNPEFEIQQRKLGMSFHQVLTLASIIEKETNYVPEMPLISSVFHNRLQKKMRLQSDPTVIYGLSGYNGNIRKIDLSNPHLYNTYRHKGLPPGPIGSARIEAIRAALFPEKSKFLYFVSKKNGSHYFSESYSEHSAAVQKFQLQ